MSEEYFDLTENHCINLKYINTIQLFKEIDKENNAWYFLVVDLTTGQQYLGPKERCSQPELVLRTNLNWPMYKVAEGSDSQYIIVNPAEIVEKRIHASKFAHIKLKTPGKWLDFEYERYWSSVQIKKNEIDFKDLFN